MSRDDRPFLLALFTIGGAYVILIFAMVVANAQYVGRFGLAGFRSPEIQYAIWFSLLTSTASALLSTFVAVPLGYVMSRIQFRGKRFLDAVLDIPIVLPPLVVGLSLLILFQTLPGRLFQDHVFPVTYQRISVVLAQFAVGCAFAVRAMKITFDQMTPRSEQVAMTLGCTWQQAFFRVVLPEARRGILAAFAIAWARSFGEFGPVLVFSGATRLKTEVLSTTVFLELSVGRLEAAAAVSLFMVVVALIVLLILRFLGPADAVGRTVRP
jgi:molybdate transport system permease protein